MASAPGKARLYAPSLVTLLILLPFFAYYVRQVKTQEGFLNSRAFRVLDVASRQFAAEVQGARDTMDAAVRVRRQFALRRRSGVLTDLAQQQLKNCPAPGDCEVAAKAEVEGYLSTYLADSDSFAYEEQVAGIEKGDTFLLSRRHGISPAHINVEVRRPDPVSEGKPVLAGAPVKPDKPLFCRIRASLDPTRMLNRAVGQESAGVFDTVLVATEDGAVIAQTANPAANVRDVEALLGGRKTKRKVEEGSPAGDAEKKSAPLAARGEAASVATQFAGAEERVDVEVSGEAYVLFSIPAPVTLAVEGSTAAVPLVFYGLARKETWEARAMQLPSISVPALLLALIMGMALLWPVLQLQTMSPKERLRKSTLAMMAGSSLFAAVLFAALFLVTGFSLRLDRQKDGQLGALSRQIQAHFAWETDQAIHTGQQTIRYLARSKPEHPQEGFVLLSSLLENLADVSPTDPDYQIRQDLLSYPYFAHIILTSSRDPEAPTAHDGLERQIIKLSADAAPTPLIPLPLAGFPFVDRLLNGPYAILNGDGRHRAQEFTLESLLSPNTGEFLPVMMFYPNDTPADPEKGASGVLKSTEYRVMIATHIPSLVRVLPPRGFGFAVVNDEGRVLFHSDTARNLRENFYGECDETAELEKAVVSRSQAWLALRYGGRKVRMFVQPLAAKDSEENSRQRAGGNRVPGISNLDLSLIVYYDSDAKKDLFYALGRQFLGIAAGLPVAALLLAMLWIQLRGTLFPRSRARYSSDRPWPWEYEKTVYIVEGLWGIGWFLFAFAAGICCPMESRVSGHLPMPVRVLLLLLFALVAGVGGLILSWRKHPWAVREANRRWLRRWKEHIPLSAAFSLRLFSGALAVTGILALMIFQVVLWDLQMNEDAADVRAAATAMELRMERNIRIWRRSSAAMAGCQSQPGSNCLARQFQEARISGAGYFDIYDPIACPGVEPEVSNRLKLVAPELAGRLPAVAATPHEAGGSHAGVRLAGPCVQSPTRPSTWRIAPEVFVDGAFNWRGLGFHGLGLLVIALLFLWKHSLVRRLFILDFRPPEPLPQTDESHLRRAMEAALRPGPHSLRRTLIFAHPRSGTGETLRRILEALKKEGLIPAEVSQLDCAILLGGRPEDDGGWRKAVVEAQARGRLAILDNFATGLSTEMDRKDKLALLEKVVYAKKPHVYVITSIDPLLFMQSLTGQKPADDALRQETDRWARVLSSFELVAFEEVRQDSEMDAAVAALERHGQALGLSPKVYAEYGDMFECELNPTVFLRRCASRVDVERLDWSTPRHFEQTMVTQVRALADGYYRVVWLNCTGDERLALFQLAKDDWMNPANKVGIAHLLRKKLVNKVAPGDLGRKDGAYRLMNESFREFVLEAAEEREAAAWAAEQNRSLWPSMRIALMLAVGLLVLFMAYVRRDLFDVYFSYFAALAGGSAALLKIVMQLFSKDETKLAAVLGGGKSEKGGEEKA